MTADPAEVPLARVVVLTAHPDDVVRARRRHEVARRWRRNDVRVLTVVSPVHVDLLRVVHGDPDTAVPAGGGAVLALRGPVGLAAAGWTAVEHGTSELVGVITVSTARRRGFGATVVTAAVHAAAGAGADLVWLRTHDAGALRLYRSLGFEPTTVGSWP